MSSVYFCIVQASADIVKPIPLLTLLFLHTLSHRHHSNNKQDTRLSTTDGVLSFLKPFMIL